MFQIVKSVSSCYTSLMINFPFAKDKKKDKQNKLSDGMLFFSIDIGTELLKGLLCRMTSSGVEVLKSAQIWQQHHAMRSGVIQNIDTVNSNIELLYNELISDLISQKADPSTFPKHVILGVAGELVHGESILANFDREEDSSSEITEEEQKNIIEEVRETVIESGISDVSNLLGLKTDDIVPLHVDLAAMEIGILRVSNLVGYKGRTVKLYFNTVFAPYTFVEAVISVVKNLGLQVITVVAQPFAVARAFKGSDDVSFDGIFIDIGGGTTDIAVVKKGTIVNSYMLAFGSRVFTERIAKEMNLDYRYAEKRKIKYSEGSLRTDIAKDVKNILRKDISLWADGVRIALSQFEDIDTLPGKIYLCGGGSLLPDIKDILIAYPWKQKTIFFKHPTSTRMRIEDLDHVVDKSNVLDSILYITPASIAVYAWFIFMESDYHLSLQL